MSDIKEMNEAIQHRSAGWAAVAAVVTAAGISPQAIVEATHGELTGKLAWGSLVLVFTAAALLVEAADVGRHSPHRRKINKHITSFVMQEACSNKQCPEVSAPSPKTRDAAMSVFYKLVDKPSREVAFHQWAWYYTSLHWITFSLLGLLVVVASWPFVSTDFPVFRGLSVLVLFSMLAAALYIRRTWTRKTFTYSSAQVGQIASDLPGSLKATACTEEPCPLQ